MNDRFVVFSMICKHCDRVARGDPVRRASSMIALFKALSRLSLATAALMLAVHVAHAQNGQGGSHGAPGPTVGDGLAALLLIGGSV